MSKSIPIAAPSPEKKKKGFEDYEVEGAANDLMRAEEHKTKPELMAAVHKHVHKKRKALRSISDLKKVQSKMVAESNKAKGAAYDEDALEE